MLGGLFKNIQMQGAQKTEPRGVYEYTLSGAACSATQQMSVFQQSLSTSFFPSLIFIPILTFALIISLTHNVFLPIFNLNKSKFLSENTEKTAYLF
jgi:hypothetical protein